MNKSIIAALLCAVGVVGAIEYTAEALADQVTNLPGTEGLDIKFNQFSGEFFVFTTAFYVCVIGFIMELGGGSGIYNSLIY